MTLSDLFKSFGAPLVNVRRSWGAVREADGGVILRVWQDRWRKIDGKPSFEVFRFNSDEWNEDGFGFEERSRHVELIREGAPSLMVVCEARDTKAHPREIKPRNDYSTIDVFVGGALIDVDGDWWLESRGRRPRAG